jgi:serine protease Do
MSVFRRGKTTTVAIVVGELDADRVQRAPAPAPAEPAQSMRVWGLGLADLTPAQKRELRISSGARIEAVDGPAARAGLRVGDVLIAIAEAALARADSSRPLNVLVRRGDWAQYALIRPGR